MRGLTAEASCSLHGQTSGWLVAWDSRSYTEVQRQLVLLWRKGWEYWASF